MYDNLFFYGYIAPIGGVETFYYEIARKYSGRDITLLYKSGDRDQLMRLAEHIRIRRWNGEKIRCRRAFFGYNFEALDAIEAEEYIQIIHADFKELSRAGWKPKVDRRFTRYIAVSENNARSFEELSGIRPEVCYNAITAEKPRKVLHLISATRLSWEKGGTRMRKLAAALDAAGVRYIWTVYTNDPGGIDSPNVIFAKPRLDIADYIADADYLVQLSDTEGYSYSLLEALTYGTPVLVTPLPINSELGIVNGVNGWVLPFDMSEIPVEQICKGLKRFKYKPHPDGWDALLLPGESTWEAEKAQGFAAEAAVRFHDLEADRIREQGERWACSLARLRDLENKGLARMV